MSEHTPGPWFISKKGGPFCVDAPCEPDNDFRIAKTYASPFAPNQKQSAANARLIATAPTMHDYIESRAKAGDAEAIAIIKAITGA
jgi:hypothetical protein